MCNTHNLISQDCADVPFYTRAQKHSFTHSHIFHYSVFKVVLRNNNTKRSKTMTNTRQRCGSRRLSSNFFQKVWLLLCTLVSILPSVVQCQLCRRLDNTWRGFVQTVRAIEESSGYAVVCPFEISGDDCPSSIDFPSGYHISEGSSLILICDPDLFGYNNDNNECIINCPGVHFSLGETASLTLDGVTLAGATDSSIQVEAQATLRIINSIFRE
jgi:hypothetical protein